MIRSIFRVVLLSESDPFKAQIERYRANGPGGRNHGGLPRASHFRVLTHLIDVGMEWKSYKRCDHSTSVILLISANRTFDAQESTSQIFRGINDAIVR
jgi:hypothetical protein